MKKYVIVDVDGTILNATDRVHLLTQEKPDWDAFYDACDEDMPIEPVIDLIKNLSDRYHIVFCTSRHDKVRDKTRIWIDMYTSLWMSPILMRKTGDIRHDIETKPELLDRAGINTKNTAFILEDRNSMVKHWRSLGFTCLQVAEGDF